MKEWTKEQSRLMQLRVGFETSKFTKTEIKISAAAAGYRAELLEYASIQLLDIFEKENLVTIY